MSVGCGDTPERVLIFMDVKNRPPHGRFFTSMRMETRSGVLTCDIRHQSSVSHYAFVHAIGPAIYHSIRHRPAFRRHLANYCRFDQNRGSGLSVASAGAANRTRLTVSSRGVSQPLSSDRSASGLTPSDWSDRVERRRDGKTGTATKRPSASSLRGPTLSRARPSPEEPPEALHLTFAFDFPHAPRPTTPANAPSAPPRIALSIRGRLKRGRSRKDRL